MINLLPPKEKQQLIFQKNRNLIVVLGSITIIFLVCLGLVLLSLKFYILQRFSYETSNLDEIKSQYQTSEYMSLLDSLKNYNELLLRADSFYKKEGYLSGVLDMVLGVSRPSGITFNNVVLERFGTNKVKVAIYGLSSTRDDLLLFQENIRNQSTVKNVNLPADNLVKPSNISFSLTFEVQSVK